MDMPDQRDQVPETNKVFEYYKKYSQNPDLVKYFTGPDAEIVKTASTSKEYKSNAPAVSTHLEVKIISCMEDLTVSATNQEEIKNASPTSSIASNKKLEWDNGADIGYSNSYKLSTKKSASFPNLFSNDISNKNTKVGEDKSVSETVRELRNMYHQLTFSSETSASPTKENTSSTATSSKEPTPPKSLSTGSDLVHDKSSSNSTGNSNDYLPFLKKQIGVPMANSTPNEDSSSKNSDQKDYTETPFIKNKNRPKRNSVDKKQIDLLRTGDIVEIDDCQKDKVSMGIQTIEHQNQANLPNVNSEVNSQNINNHRRFIKEVNLCITKPISLECATMFGRASANKVSQTTLSPKKISRSIQADIYPQKKVIHSNPIGRFTPQSQKIEFITYNNDDFSLKNISTNSRSSSENSHQEKYQHLKSKMGVYCNLEEAGPELLNKVKKNESAKRLEKTEMAFIDTKILSESDPNSIQEDESGEVNPARVKTGDKKVDFSSTSAKSSNSSTLENKSHEQNPSNCMDQTNTEEILLAEMISLNHSRDLNTDIKRSIDILQKLLKSKKYDHITKKHYIKKIVQKIVESKYSEDSTTSSELFRPKRKPSTSKVVADDLKGNAKLMDNIPWYPVIQDKYQLQVENPKNADSTKSKTEVFHVRNFDNVSKLVTIDDQYIKIKSQEKRRKSLNIVPLSDQKENIQQSASPQDILSSDGFFYTKCSQIESDPTLCSTKMREENWKGAKTLSERILENRNKTGSRIGQGDYVLHVAKNERHHQLSWIKNEIEHLMKLKEMLEKKAKMDPQTTSIMSSLLKMKVDDMKADFGGRSMSRKSNSSSTYKPIPSQEMLPKDAEVTSQTTKEDTPTVLAVNNEVQEKREQERLEREQREREQREYEQQERERREREQQEREQREREQRQREQWDAEQREREREQWERERSEREQQEREQREHQQREREQWELEQRERELERERWEQEQQDMRDRQRQEQDDQQKRSCCCSTMSCACSGTATHEEKNFQCPAYLQRNTQTEAKGDARVQCNCTEDVGVGCTCNLKMCTCSKKDAPSKDGLCPCKSSSESSSATSSENASKSSSSESYMSCICCKKEKMLKSLTDKLALCSPCQKVNQKGFYPYNYSSPLHSCLCYSLVDHDLLCQLKDTLTELQRLETYHQYSKILENCRSCKKCGCNCKLPKKNKKGVAYFLKLENACPNTHCRMDYGEDQSEYSTQFGEEDTARSLPEITVKVPNCRGPCALSNDGKKSGSRKNKSCPSIQAYLVSGKPDFIYRAERRRKILRKATLEREEDIEDRKLKFADRMSYLNHMQNIKNDIDRKNSRGIYGQNFDAYCVPDVSFSNPSKIVKPRVFRSFKEMKDLTRRHYLHLPEVRNKKSVYKEMRLREANRLLANTFTKRLQRSTLRGAVDIPSNVRVISY